MLHCPQCVWEDVCVRERKSDFLYCSVGLKGHPKNSLLCAGMDDLRREECVTRKWWCVLRLGGCRWRIRLLVLTKSLTNLQHTQNSDTEQCVFHSILLGLTAAQSDTVLLWAVVLTQIKKPLLTVLPTQLNKVFDRLWKNVSILIYWVFIELPVVKQNTSESPQNSAVIAVVVSFLAGKLEWKNNMAVSNPLYYNTD